MKNFEKYKDEIFEILARTSQEIPSVINGKLVLCDDIRCRDCELDENNGSNCIQNFIKWLYEDDGEKQSNCLGCKYMYKKIDESPCTECSMNYTSKWERRLKKTRQDEFLKLFPRAERDVEGFIDIAPCQIDKALKTEVDIRGYCQKANGYETGCRDCMRAYWNEEVE